MRAGCHKCDFLVKKEDYGIFLSQLPQRSLLPTPPTLSPDIIPEIDLNEFVNNSKKLRYNEDTKKVIFKLRLDDDLRTNVIIDNEDAIYIDDK